MSKVFSNENEFQQAVNNDLKQLHIKFKHDEAGRSGNKTHRKGWPDLTVYPGHNRAFFVELKMPNKDLRPDQKEFRDWCVTTGYHFYVIYSWTDWELVKKMEGLFK